ncbi:MAG TPA: DUF1491 family protein [Allosphingosinicella sp.]|nr:DUF1491 family protein [Allosphingosinicella sp.]
MIQPRLAASVLASGLLRRAESQGGFGTVLAKGDVTAGSIVLILVERGANPRILERILGSGGDYAWAESPFLSVSDKEVPAFIARRRRFDPDLWVLELDVPDAERFAAELGGLD